MGMFNFIGNWRNALNDISPVNIRKFADKPITQLTGLSDRQLHPLESGLDEWATQHDNKYQQGGSYGNATDAAMIALMTMGAGSALGAGAGAAGGSAGGAAGGTAAAAPAAYGTYGAGAAGAGSYGAGAYGTAAGYGGAGAATVMPATGAASGGILGTMGSYAKPVAQGIGTASQAKGLLTPPPQQPMQQPQNNSAQGAQLLQQIYQNSMNPQVTPEQQARTQRRSMWG